MRDLPKTTQLVSGIAQPVLPSVGSFCDRALPAFLQLKEGAGQGPNLGPDRPLGTGVWTPSPSCLLLPRRRLWSDGYILGERQVFLRPTSLLPSPLSPSSYSDLSLEGSVALIFKALSFFPSSKPAPRKLPFLKSSDKLTHNEALMAEESGPQ